LVMVDRKVKRGNMRQKQGTGVLKEQRRENSEKGGGTFVLYGTRVVLDL